MSGYYNNLNLEEEFGEVDDITDPSNMDKVLMIYEEMEMENDAFIELLLDKLQDMVITWHQPWYQKSSSLTRRPKDPENEDVERFKTDTISKWESDLIAKNWKEFCKEFQVPDTPHCFARWRNRKRRKHTSPVENVRQFVTAYVAQGLERSCYHIYRYFVAHYGCPVKRSEYSAIEEKIMEICFYHDPRNAVPILATVLGREPRGIYKKIKQYFHGEPDKKRMKWTLPLATKFLTLLMRYSGLSFKELKYAKIDNSVWIKMAEDMNQQFIYLRVFWFKTLHNQLYVKESFTLNRLRYRIFKKLRRSSYRYWSDIRWKEVVQEFPNLTHLFLYSVAHEFFRRNREYRKVPLKKLLEEALVEIKSEKLRNRRFRPIEFTNGCLQYVE